FKSIGLQQGLGSHHRLQLTCRSDMLEASGGEVLGATKDFLGSPVSLRIASLGGLKGFGELLFKGVVTGIEGTNGSHGHSGDMVTISAGSPTVAADDGPHYFSHNDAPLADIVDLSLSGYGSSGLATAIRPRYTDPLHYTVQHNESSWGYLGRLAAQYGEWFYYDGTKLFFGLPGDGDPVALYYGLDLHRFSLSLEPLPNTINYFTNDYLTDRQHQKKTTGMPPFGGYNGFASKKSGELYARETNVWVNGHTGPRLKKRFDKMVENQKMATEQRQVTFTGSSDNPGVGLGKVIEVKDGGKGHGRYRVTEVTHTANENGRYRNTFRAVSAEQDSYPLTDLGAFPRSGPQTAVVTENADPDGMGRVRVRFGWQRPFGGSTPWVRIVTPHAGGGKGFHFVPEVGEEVLVGFEGGNAERPYVMGALYNGDGRAEPFMNADNDIKAIRTRSGHTIELNDRDGGETITITDRNKNLITIDTAKNSMTITALEDMTFNARNMQINVEENMKMNIGQNKAEYIGQNHDINSSNSTEMVSQAKSVNVGALYNQYSASANLIATAGDMTIHSKGVSTFQGNADVKISKG
ncbi:MAG: type VI secretion system Vgr family protein, partial [Marinirhabdus sp.]